MAPWTVAHQAPLSSAVSQSLLKFMSIESVMLSNHLILYCPLLLSSSSFPSIKVFSSELALGIRWPKYWSFSFSFSPSNECSGLISFGIDQRAGRNSWDWGWDEFLGSSGGLSSTLISLLCLKAACSLRQSHVSASPTTCPFEAYWPPYPQILLWVTLSDCRSAPRSKGTYRKVRLFLRQRSLIPHHLRKLPLSRKQWSWWFVTPLGGFCVIYLFVIFACAGSSLLCAGFSLVAMSGGYSSWLCAGFSLRWLPLWNAGSRALRLSNCDTWA